MVQLVSVAVEGSAWAEKPLSPALLSTAPPMPKKKPPPAATVLLLLNVQLLAVKVGAAGRAAEVINGAARGTADSVKAVAAADLVVREVAPDNSSSFRGSRSRRPGR